jgi:hypothetical protein
MDEVLGSVHVVRVVRVFFGDELASGFRVRGLAPGQAVHEAFFALLAQPPQHAAHGRCRLARAEGWVETALAVPGDEKTESAAELADSGLPHHVPGKYLGEVQLRCLGRLGRQGAVDRASVRDVEGHKVRECRELAHGQPGKSEREHS